MESPSSLQSPPGWIKLNKLNILYNLISLNKLFEYKIGGFDMANSWGQSYIVCPAQGKIGLSWIFFGIIMDIFGIVMKIKNCPTGFTIVSG